MNLNDVSAILQAEVLTGHERLNVIDVEFAFGCDLISDMLAFVKNKTILLTGLTNIQLIKTAKVLDISAIVFVRGKKPPSEVIETARLADIPLMVTRNTMFTACGLLYKCGLKG